MEAEVRERRVENAAYEWPEFDAMFEERLAAEDFSDATVLDLGTGAGRLALFLARKAKIVVGIDTDGDAIAEARAEALKARATNASFFVADADAANYRLLVRSPIDYVVANHFMSEAAIRATAKALRAGGRFLFACHHADHWRESDRPSHFSFTQEGMRELLAENGFAVEFLGVERLVLTYRDLGELAESEPRLHEKFREDGRWDALRGRFPLGPVELTWSTLVGVATKP